MKAERIEAHGTGPSTEEQVTQHWHSPPSLWLARICLLGALCGAGYLASVSVTGGGVAGCGPESGCNRVLSSRWAYWLGVPVSMPAFASYVTLLALTFGLDPRRREAVQRRSWKGVICLSILVLGAVLWFVLLQMIVLKAWCRLCLATHLSAAVAAVLLIKNIRSRGAYSPPTIGRQGRNWTASLLGAGLGLAILVAGQVLVRKRLYAVSLFSGRSAWAAHEISLHGGKFKLNTDELPVLGSTSETNYIVSLFDYTCSHCRALHPLLQAARERYQGRLGIVALPMPLDAACNPLILVTAPANQDACEYARLSLAVWRARREAFAQFDDWLFASAAPPPLENARAKAEALAGKEALQKALSSSWVDRQLRIDISLYQANARSVGDAHLPQLVIGDVITHGAIESVEDLSRLFEQHLHLGKAGQLESNPSDSH